jgi:hypothetical protein
MGLMKVKMYFIMYEQIMAPVNIMTNSEVLQNVYTGQSNKCFFQEPLTVVGQLGRYLRSLVD